MRTAPGGVAFAQPPATSLNPYRMKTDDVTEQKPCMAERLNAEKWVLYLSAFDFSAHLEFVLENRREEHCK